MTTYYVGPGGSDAAAGTSWAVRKLTLSGAEAIPVAANDTVYVAPGTYRETLTCGVSGTAGNPITYIGDYSGANTDGVGGIVRITGSNDDKVTTRNNCIAVNAKNYRTFTGFLLDTCATVWINISGSNIIISKCLCMSATGAGILVTGAISNVTLTNMVLMNNGGNAAISFTHTSTVSNAGHVLSNLLFMGGWQAILDDRIGGITVTNSTIWGMRDAIRINTALAAGQTMTVNNCIIAGCNNGLVGTATSEIIENYNNIYGCSTARTNTNTGANSVAYSPLFDPRWFFQLVA